MLAVTIVIGIAAASLAVAAAVIAHCPSVQQELYSSFSSLHSNTSLHPNNSIPKRSLHSQLQVLRKAAKTRETEYIQAFRSKCDLARIMPRYAWVHVPKAGTSFGATLLHAHNPRLPLSIGFPVCEHSGTMPLDIEMCRGISPFVSAPTLTERSCTRSLATRARSGPRGKQSDSPATTRSVTRRISSSKATSSACFASPSHASPRPSRGLERSGRTRS